MSNRKETEGDINQTSQEQFSFKITKGHSRLYQMKKNIVKESFGEWFIKTLLRGIFYFFLEPANLFYLIVSLIMIIGGSSISMYPGPLYLVLLAVLLFVRLISFFIYEKKRFKVNKIIGMQKFFRVTKATLRGTKLTKKDLHVDKLTPGQELCVGDIIKFKKYDIVPCDCVLLAASDKKNSEYVCFVDTTLSHGKLEREKKHSIALARSFTHLTFKEKTSREFVRRITGKVDYFPYDKSKDLFKGNIKLKSDPKVEQLENKNLLMRGSIIRSKFAYGLVVFTGNEATTLKGQLIERGKRSSIHGTVTLYSTIAIASNLLMSLVSVMTQFVRTQNNDVLKELDPNLKNGLRAFTFFVLYCPIVPLSMLVMIEISNVLFARRMEAKYRNFTKSPGYEEFLKTQKIETEKKDSKMKRLVTNVEEKKDTKKIKNSFKIFNANVLPDLGCTDHIFFDKTGTLVTPDYEIITVATTTRIYKSEDNNFLNEGIMKAIKQFERGRIDDNLSDENSAVFSEGSRRSMVSNPNYDFTIKMNKNNPLSSRSSKAGNPETQNLLNDGEGNISRSSVYHPSRKAKVDTLPRINTKGLSLKKSTTGGKAMPKRDLRLNLKGGGVPKNATVPGNQRKMKKGILKKIYDEFDFFKDTIKDFEVKKMMKMFTICHNSTHVGDSFESSSFEEKAMLVFSKNFNYDFISDDYSGSGGNKLLKKLTLSFNGKKKKDVNIWIINEEDSRKRFSVLASKPGKKGSILYVRGVHESMRDLMDLGIDEKNYEDLVDHNSKNGLRTYVYAKKELSQKETNEFVDQYDKYRRKLLDQRVNMKNLAIKMEKNLKLMCVLGFKNKYKGEAVPVIKNLKDMGVRVSMLTGDEYIHAKMTANLVGMIKYDQEVNLFNFNDKEGGVSAIKEVLEKFKVITTGSKKNMSTQSLKRIDTSVSVGELEELNKTVIIFSGEAWNLMRQSSYLHSHFMFICQFARSIIGYELSSKNKQDFVKEFTNFNSDHKKIITCVGDGFNDMGMLQEAAVGIQIQSNMVNVIFGDIIVNNLAVIPVIMRKEGRTLHSNLKQTILIFFGQALGTAIIAFFYQFFCSFSGAPIINSELLQLNYILIFLNGLIFVMSETKFNPKLNEIYPSFYMQRIYTLRFNMSNFLFELLITSIESIWILYFTMVAYIDQRNSNGEIGNMHMVSISICLASQFLTSFKFVIRSKNATVLMFIYTVISTFIMLSLISIFNGLIFLRPAFDIAGFEIFDHYNCGYVLLSSTLFTCLFSWIMWETALRKRRFPILCDVENRVRIGDLDFLVPSKTNKPNEQYLKTFNDNQSFSSVVSHCFTSNDSIDMIIENILSSLGNSTSDISIKKSNLKFFTTMLEKKYKIFALKRFLDKTQIQIFGSLVVYLLTTILIIIIQSDVQNILTGAGITLLILIVSLISYSRIFRSNVFINVILIMILIIGVASFNSLIKGREHTILYSIVILLITTNYNITFNNVRWLVALHFLAYIIVSIINYSSSYEGYLWDSGSGMDVKIYAFGSLILLGILMTILSVVQRYKNELLIKNEFKAGSYMQNKSKITKELLGLLLPKFVLEKFETYEVTDYKIGEDVGEVTVMFCDIAEFDKVVRERQDDIVRILDSLFRKFDELCTIHGLQKIETVGKTYMACGGLKYVEDTLPASMKVKNPTLRILDFAKDMMATMKDFDGLRLKIGIHYGKCMMGVIGYHKPQFSLIGDTINTTSRHCTTGVPEHIMLSKEAWAFLNESNARASGYTYSVIPTKMKGKTKKNQLIEVYHVYRAKRKFFNKFKNALAKADQNGNNAMTPQLNVLRKVFTEDRKKVIAPDFKKLALIIDQVKNNMDSLRQLQSKALDGVKKSKKKKPKVEKVEDDFDDLSPDEFEISSTDDDEQILKPNLLLRFKNYEIGLVKRYFESIREANSKYLRTFHFILFFQNLVQTLMYTMNKDSVTQISEMRYFAAVILRGVNTVIVLFMIIYNGAFYTYGGKIIFNLLYFYISASGVLQIYLLEGLKNLYYSHIMIVELIFTFVCAIQCGVMDFVQSFVYYIFQFIIYVLFYIFTMSNPGNKEWTELVNYMGFFLISGFYSLLNNYIYISTEIEGFNSESQNQKKVEEMDAFINRLLPRHTVKTLGMEGIENKGDVMEEVTLIFADIKGFTAYSSEHTPDEVVDLVYSLFTSFDKECNRLGLYKVYTIGDCYVAMSFIDKDNRKAREEEAFDVLKFGFKMIEMIAQTREDVNFPKLKMRIGIHTGRVIGGVVGTGIIRFDMYGPDVAIANAMESEGIPDEVKVSAATKKLLDKYAEKNDGKFGYYFVKQEDVPIKKLKIEVENYLVKIDDQFL